MKCFKLYLKSSLDINIILAIFIHINESMKCNFISFNMNMIHNCNIYQTRKVNEVNDEEKMHNVHGNIFEDLLALLNLLCSCM